MQSTTDHQVHISRLYQEPGNTAETYICARIEDQIAYYEAKSARNKKYYYVLSVLSIVANALIPVCSVFLKTAEGDEPMKLLVTFLSSFALIMSSLLVLFNSRELWTRYRSGATSLTSLLHQYYTRTGPFEDMEDEPAFRMLARMSESYFVEENEKWGVSLRSAGEQKKP